MRTFAALLLAVVAAGAFAQDAYRWIGKDGKVHYSDEAPPADAQKIEPKHLDASVVEGDKYSYETRQAVANFPVVLYVSASCGDGCSMARKFLSTRGIPYSEKKIETAADVAAMKEATDSDVTPTLRVGTMTSKGFQEEAWGGLLDTAGYPPAK